MKQLRTVLLAFFFLFQIHSVIAGTVDKKVTLYFFWQKGCPHCTKESFFLKNLHIKYSYLEIKKFEISENAQNGVLLETMSKELHFRASSLPVTIVNDRYFIGFQDENTNGKQIEEAVIEAYQNGSEKTLPDSGIESSDSAFQENLPVIPDSIQVPFFKQIKINDLSLPLLSIALGAIDGFNPCAMWVLVMLLSFLIGIQNRKRMIILGCLFLFASAFVYFLFLVAWLNFMLFLSYIPLIKISIGVIATLAGAFYLKEFWKNKEGVCKVTGSKQKKYISEKLEQFVKEKHFFLAACAIVILAFLVNIVELVCSAGIPAIYTQVLALTPLSTAEYYFYIFLYLFFFILDDLVVFFVAVFSLRLMNLTAKYTRYSHLIGGSLLILIGMLLIFKPEWLMFG